jgi:hypothetical protein
MNMAVGITPISPVREALANAGYQFINVSRLLLLEGCAIWI